MDLQKQAERCQARGLYRAASPRDVLWSLVWNGGRFEDLTRVCRVDCFISHVSSSASWGKALALCQYLNFDLAFASSILTWIITFLGMLLLAGSYTALLSQDFYFLNLILIASPTAVFIVAYFGGHVMSRKALWFDQVCVSQSPLARLETIQAIPCFIATAKDMVVLWDETFFERLWCVHEIGCFLKSTGSDRIHILPTWLPLWILGGLSMAGLTMIGIMLSFQTWAGVHNTASEMQLFWCYVDVFFGYAYAVGPFLMVAQYFFLQKLRLHGLMLDQMADFEFRQAGCALETDRVAIQRHVLRLFDEALEEPLSVSFGVPEAEESMQALVSPEDMDDIRNISSYPTQEEVLEQFNAYVRGPLRSSVVRRLGRKDDIPFKACAAGMLPWLFGSLVYACDGEDCEVRAKDTGLSVAGYVHLKVAMSTLFVCGLCSIGPMLLRANALIEAAVSNSAVRMLLAVIASALVSILQAGFQAFVVSFGFVATIKGSSSFALAFLSSLSILAAQLWLLFKTDRTTSRGLCVA